MMRHFAFLLIAALALTSCARAPVASLPDTTREDIAANLMQDISVLASDEFGGRAPGTDGERLTVDYLIAQMQAAGLVSGTNDPGSAWRAPVALLSTQPGTSRIAFETRRGVTTLNDEQGAAFTSGSQALVDAPEMLFVGMGDQTFDPEVLSGQVLVMLAEPGRSPERREALFAAEPAAIVTVVEDAQNIAAVRRAYSGERLLLARDEVRRLSVFVTAETMRNVLGAQRWDALAEGAQASAFAPVAVPARIAIDARSQRREFVSSNVIGMLPGQVPGSGAVLLMGHWDHLGECAPEGAPDRICNGAIDNASGLALMLELARRLAASGPHDRDIYWLATSAEESGLLGARAFAEAPPMPLETIVAAFNFDSVTLAPAGAPVGFVGQGRTPLDPVILEVLVESGRTLGDRDYAESFVRRQDGWALLREGVPAVMLSSAFASRDVLGPYLEGAYHSPSDEAEGLELGGAIDDLLLHEALIRRLASTARYAAPPPEQ